MTLEEFTKEVQDRLINYLKMEKPEDVKRYIKTEEAQKAIKESYDEIDEEKEENSALKSRNQVTFCLSLMYE